MRYTGLNPNGINQVASGSVAISVENTRVATFGTNTLQVTGSTILSGSLAVTGPETLNGNFKKVYTDRGLDKIIPSSVKILPMMYLALSYDHRIIDGRASVSFLVRVKQLLEDPTRLLFGV